jgi:CHAT domain-containing protein
MEESRADLRRAEHRISFFSSLDRFYEDYVDFLVQTGRSAQALAVADGARARLLREKLGTRTKLTAGTEEGYRALARALDVVILFYWVAPRRSFLWVVTPRGVQLEVLPGEGEIRSRAEAHQARILRSRDPVAEGAPDAAWLYETLVGPAEPAIRAGSRVLVVPDGPLHPINFDTLVDPSPKPRYWIEDVTLVTAPSLSLLGSPRRGPVPSSPSALIIGDPAPSEPDFPRLAHAATEVERVSDQFAPPQRVVYAGTQAEPAVYATAEPGRFSLIHFAAHAKANPLIPLDSAVILSPRNDSFKLYAREIIDIPLRADLVTLSACRSAGSRIYAGEGQVGLAWAFLSAGASNVIAGLWNVEDASTAELMGELYRGLKEGLAPAEALRAAKLRLLRSETAWRKPFYWAPFVIYTQRPTAGRAS